MDPPRPVIFVPGITATTLDDHYPVGSPDPVWGVIRKKWDEIALHPANLRYELNQPSVVQAGHLFGVAYGDFIEELREELAPAPVFPFPYDWRHRLCDSADLLINFILGVRERTALIPEYMEEGLEAAEIEVDLVGHSMGGLIIAGATKGLGHGVVGKVVTIGTPWQGSIEAALRIMVGTANMGNGETKARERRAARLTPALYNMLPTNPLLLEGCDLLNGVGWQRSIHRTLQEYIDEYCGPDPTIDSVYLLNTMLADANEYNDVVASFRPGPRGYLCIAGAGAETRTRLVVSESEHGPEWDLSLSHRVDNWSSNTMSHYESGDGTVPLAGSVPTFFNEYLENMVFVTPDDFGYWELGDKALLKVAGFHGILCRMNLVHRLTTAFLRAPVDEWANGNRSIWGRSFPTVSRETWNPPFKNLEKKTP